MATENINLIFKKYHHMIESVDVEPEGIDVWLKRPFVFSCTHSSCTFMPFELFEDKKNPKKSAIWAVNQCIRDEAMEIDPEEWDKG